MAAAAKIREETGVDVETLWGDDGFVVRFPDVDEPPDPRLLLPDPDEVQALVVRQLGATALFAAKFRENAARSLLLPKRRPGMRAPLWQQRKRAADLLAVASRYGSFPVLLETYRECLRDFFDMPALDQHAGRRPQPQDPRRDGRLRKAVAVCGVAALQLRRQLPLRRRRAARRAARAGAGGRPDAAARAARRRGAARAARRRVDGCDRAPAAAARSAGTARRSADGVHDMLLAIGDLTREELRARALNVGRRRERRRARRRAPDSQRAHRRRDRGTSRSRTPRATATRSACRCRPAFPSRCSQPVRDPLGDLALRYARTHAPFTAADFAARYGLGPAAAEAVLLRLTAEGRLVEGEFRPGGTEREWTDAGVLRMLRRRSLAKLRHEVEPVDQAVLGRFATTWQGVVEAAARRRRAARRDRAAAGRAAARLDSRDRDSAGAARRLRSRRSRRRHGRRRSRLGRRRAARRARRPRRALSRGASAEVVAADGRHPPHRLRQGYGGHEGGSTSARVRGVRLPPRLKLRRTAEPWRRRSADHEPLDARETKILEFLRSHGASFFGPLHEAAGGGYPAETRRGPLESRVEGLVTNDTFHALRAFTRTHAARHTSPGRPGPGARGQRVPIAAPRAAVGRRTVDARPNRTARRPTRPGGPRRSRSNCSPATASSRAKAVAAESIPGGFGSVYPVLKTLEETGRVRRGYFVAGLGATQFALPGALDLLRSLRDPAGNDSPEVAVLAATDPANPYGATLKWPAVAAHAATARQAPDSDAATAGRGPTRSVGATVILVDGALGAYLARGDRQLTAFLPEAEPAAFPRRARGVARAHRACASRRRRAARDADRGDRRRASGRARTRSVSRRSGVHWRGDGVSGYVQKNLSRELRAIFVASATTARANHRKSRNR